MQNAQLEILLIEDSIAEAGLIGGMLSSDQKQGYAVQHVRSLAEGLDLLRSRNFDCALIDLGLADSPGLESALAVRKQSKLMPIVVLTAFDDEDTALKALQMDIQDYLIKGETTSSLLKRSIRHAIQRISDSEALRESERRFTAFMGHLPASAWIKDMAGRFVYLNAEAERVFSATFPVLLGKTDDEIFPSETARQFVENDSRLFAEGGSLQTTETLRQADGTDHHALVSKFIIRGPDGQPAFVAGVAFDITASKRQEAELLTLASFPQLSPNPILEIASEGTMTYCNPTAEEILKRTDYSSSANPFIPKDLGAILHDLQQKKFPYVFREVEANGAFFKETICLAPEHDAVRIYTMDITMRKQAEEALKISEERLRYASAAADLGTWHWNLETDELIWNEMCKLIFGYPPDYPMTYEAFLKPIHGEDRQRINAALKKALWERSDYSVEMRVVLADGQVRWVMSKGRGFYNEQGEPAGMHGVAMDITEQKQAELARRESEQRFRTLAAATSEGVVISEQGRILDVNERLTQIVGFERSELLGREVTELLPPEELKRVMANIILGQESQIEHEMLCKDGSRRIVEAHGKTIDQKGRELRITAIHDVTERKLAAAKIELLNSELATRAAELAAANEELEAFNYTVSHDLRQPLNIISSYCQVVKELCGARLDEQCRDYLREVYRGTLRMNQLINTLLNFSHTAHVELHRETVNLSAMAKEVSLELKLAVPERRATFRISDGIRAYGDPNLLRVVLENLLGNAWKYTGAREETIIEFGAIEIDGKQTCFVRDNGTGFDMLEAENLFAPFKRLPGAKEYRGLGIGLTTVERVIRRHGGRVWAEGEPGQGATFFFTLDGAVGA